MESSASTVPIFRVAHHYYLYHAPTVKRIRGVYNVPGNPIGTLPQANQQNLFLGLPLLLIPEEARLLCELGVGHIVDDAIAHRHGLADLSSSEDGRLRTQTWARRLDTAGRSIGENVAAHKDVERQAAMQKIGSKELEKRAKRAEEKKQKQAATNAAPHSALDLEDHSSETDLEIPPVDVQSTAVQLADVETYSITPSQSRPPLLLDDRIVQTLPDVPASYALFKHLHKAGYFLSPGLRFGCQYLAYPGDALRFHSHFLVVSREWDEEIELNSLIGCGRLGTGVKKGFLIGGRERNETSNGERANDDEDDRVRCFSIEWSGL